MLEIQTAPLISAVLCQIQIAKAGLQVAAGGLVWTVGAYNSIVRSQ